MSERIASSADTAGLPPGSPVYTGERPVVEATVTCYTCCPGGEVQVLDCTHGPLPALAEGAARLRWINVCGLSDVAAVERVCTLLNMHPLAVEDILNTEQRPKMEGAPDYVYFVLKAPDIVADRIIQEQVAVVLGRNAVLSFQEYSPDLFQPIINRLVKDHVPLRETSADYLAYTLVDAIVDQYFVVLEVAGERLEAIEEAVLAGRQADEAVQAIHGLKRQMILLRRSVWPLREVLGAVLRDGSPLIQPATRVYLRDVYDHTVQVMDTLDTYRDMLASLFDIYLSSISNRMNEIMKVLTLFATVFSPLTFIAGIYGMNFQHMPELSWRWSYPLVWVVMLAITVAMVIAFRRRRWL